jgi:hypothetical protein
LGWAKHLRVLAGVWTVALAATACSISNPVVGPATPGQTTPGNGSHSSSPGSGSRGTPGSTSRPGTSRTQTGGTTTDPYADDAGVGAMAKTYLRGSPATSLSVEVDWVSGRDPASSALDHLTSILRRELDKPAGITVSLGNRISSGRSSWSLADLQSLEAANRSRHSGGTRATIWICYVDGTFAENVGALAVAFSASSAAIFRDRINDATTSLVLEPEIERSVIVHEVGHLLALVNIGYRSRFDHEDPQHPHHSNNPDSVMYWAVEDVSVRNILRGGPPSDFDDADRADLAMLRG